MVVQSLLAESTVRFESSELIMMWRFSTRKNENPFHHFPVVVLIGRGHSVDLALAPDRMAVLLSSYTEEGAGADMFEPDGVFALPVGPGALDCPHI